jgi:hypothetical protein
MRIHVLSALLVLFVSSGLWTSAIAQGDGSATLDLGGKWKTEDGEEVTIDKLGSGSVRAFFEKGDCKGGGHRPQYIEGHLSGRTIKGTMWRCTSSTALMEDCGLDPVFTTTFITTLVSNDLIKGTRRTEYYGPKDDKNDKCKFKRDSSGDKDVEFSITRISAECPDIKDIEKYDQVTDRAATFTDVAAHFVKDAQISQALDSSGKILRSISNTLSVYEKTGKKCQEIHDSLDEIYQFQAAIDQINNAGCDRQALAGGFDNLFQAAGRIGKRFVKLPELQPLFAVLAQDTNFFQKVSGALDPEQRWADQFAGIDGYVPNCKQ